MRSAQLSKPASTPARQERRGVVGGVKHPLGTSDFSSYVLQAQQSGADVIALNSGGDDTVNALKAIREFGLKAKVMGFWPRQPDRDQVNGPRDRSGRLQRQPMGQRG